MTIHLRQVSNSTSEAAIRSHHVVIDRPVEKGGTDLGPMGGELFLASVGGCFMSTLLAAIKAREADVRNARADVTGLLGGTPARFEGIEIEVSAESPNPELLEWLVDIADRGCIMMNTLRGKLDIRVRTISTR